ncbi:MAG TPA: oxidoreductase [Desulfonatronum sp.]|nr:oxidoreductase [Desulfonatronum sp.]
MTHMLWVVLLPFLGALCCLILRGRAVAGTGILFSLAVLAVCTNLLPGIWTQGQIRVELGGWAAPLGIGLHLDGLGTFFLLLTAIVGVLVGLYAAGFFAQDKKHNAMGRHFWPIWLLLWGGLNGVYLCSDVFNAYVLLEVTGLSAVGLTVLSKTTASLVAGLRYLLAAMFASLMYLLGVGLLYAACGQLDFVLLGQDMTQSPATLTAFGLMVFGLLVKTALLPFHFWLPPAHSSAPAPVSAILSALVVKASFFLLLRIWFTVFPALTGQAGSSPVLPPGLFLGLLGGLAVLWGSLQAVRQIRLKLLIAYSTVGQLGYLFLIFALLSVSHGAGGGPSGATDWTAMAWTGTVFHVFSHGLAKAALFLAAGCLALAMGTDDLNAMRNIAGRMPVITFTLAMAGVSLMGLPPSAGFVAKWMLLRAALASGQWWWAVVIILGGLLTAAYVFKILAYTFVPSQDETVPLRPVPPAMTLTALALALLCAVSGFRAEEVIALLPHGLDGSPLSAQGGSP